MYFCVSMCVSVWACAWVKAPMEARTGTEFSGGRLHCSCEHPIMASGNRTWSLAVLLYCCIISSTLVIFYLKENIYESKQNIIIRKSDIIWCIFIPLYFPAHKKQCGFPYPVQPSLFWRQMRERQWSRIGLSVHKSLLTSAIISVEWGRSWDSEGGY